MSEENDGPGPVEAPLGSPLSNLRARREQKLKKLHIDIAVRGLEPLHVRFRPVTSAEMVGANKRFEPDKSNDVAVKINALILTKACVGIFDKPDPMSDPQTNPEWPKFDPTLATSLGLPEALGKPLSDIQAIDVVRGLYLTDGDIISVGVELGRWSGFTLDDVERDTAGN